MPQYNDGPLHPDLPGDDQFSGVSTVKPTPAVLAAPIAERQLIAAKDQRFQRWIFYCFLMSFSSVYFGLFLCVVGCVACHALRWFASTSPADAALQLNALGTALSKFPPTTSAIMGAVIASVVAIPLSLCVAIGKLVKNDEESTSGDSASFTSAFFELFKACAQGWKAGKS